MAIIVRSAFEEDCKSYPQVFIDNCLCELWKIQVNIRQISIKNCPDYFFNDGIIINTNDFYFSLLETNKLLFKCVFNLNVYYIK